MLTSANTSRTGQSVLEASVGQSIIHFQDLRLTGRLFASEGEEADLVLVQIHFTAYQPAWPDGAHRRGPAQQRPLPLSVAAPQVAQPAPRARLQVQSPARREHTP